MSDLKVTIERLEIFEHPNADALELAQVGLFRAVVGKGVYKTGDYALYIPEQAVLPPELIEELGLVGRLAGKDKNRVKAVRLRGELSQGIVCRPKAAAIDWAVFKNFPSIAPGHEADYAERLGITKWVPPIPVGMAGQVEPAPDLLRWIEIENIKRYPTIFQPGMQVTATEKIHGTCCLYTVTADGREYVSSKGVGAQSLALQEDTRNVYWRAVRRYRLFEFAQQLCAKLKVDAIGLFGEVYGKGVQDLHYGADASSDKTLGYVLFDIAVSLNGRRYWRDQLDVWEDAKAAGIPTAPVIYTGPYDYDLIAGLANQRESRLDPGTLREGVVVRPWVEQYSDVLGGRMIAKFVSDAYLERKGATEYE